MKPKKPTNIAAFALRFFKRKIVKSKKAYNRANNNKAISDKEY